MALPTEIRNLVHLPITLVNKTPISLGRYVRILVKIWDYRLLTSPLSSPLPTSPLTTPPAIQLIVCQMLLCQ